MQLILKINLGNAAFEDRAELPRILRELADDFEEYGIAKQRCMISDINGNTTGCIKIE